MRNVQLADHLHDLLGAGAAELPQQALDLGLDGDHLHTADGGDLLDLFVLQKQMLLPHLGLHAYLLF